jgi:hypothetical protein
MKKISVLYTAILLVLWMSLPLISVAQGAETDAALTARYQLMDKGLQKGDVPAYLSVAVPDLVTIDDDQVFPTRKEFEARLSKDIGAFSKIYSFESKITHLQLLGDFARTDVTSSFVGDRPDKKDPSVVHHFAVELKFQHEWRRIDGEWQLTRLVELGETGTIDGKPLPVHP